MNSEMKLCRSFVVSGRVQGVGFRYSTKRVAEQLELSGWVKNLPDGNVKAVAQGSPQKLAKLETWLSVGPKAATVTKVTATQMVTDNFNGFTILPS